MRNKRGTDLFKAKHKDVTRGARFYIAVILVVVFIVVTTPSS